MRQAWHDAWAPPMPATLSDQRTAELLRLQELLADLRPTEGQDGWTWCEASFSVRAAYRRLRAQAGSEDPMFLRLWRRIWRSCIPLKIRVFLWLFLRRRLMTRSLRQRWYPHSSADCALCGASLEDCDHLFIKCPLAQAVWTITRGVRLSCPRWKSFGDLWRTALTAGGQSGTSSSPHSGLYGTTETRWCSGVESPPRMQSCTKRGAWCHYGTELV